MEQYKGLTLSAFQIEAFEAINQNKNVIVSTHTGNGKTLIADYAARKCFDENKKIIYTAPIKALSNQKYRQFKKEYGKENVGLITGDKSINNLAPILVMTTEILRNILHEEVERAEDIAYIVLDEIHYINNEERGTVWEEIIIFKPKEAKIIGLSATIPNIGELCDWIKTIHDEEIVEIFYPERVVAQKHYYFDKHKKRSSTEDIAKQYLSMMQEKGKIAYRNTHIDFIKYANKEKILPVLFFVFSRKICEEKALELSEKLDLISDEEREEISDIISEYENKYPQITYSNVWSNLKIIVLKGIGYHHAGLLPIIKSFIENIFEKKLCKVLYATETFAVGINFPVKTVCFNGNRKYDGKTFRTLFGSEYLQMSGRAGRRGLDRVGLVFTLADYKYIEADGLLAIETVTSEPIKSQFNLCYNSVINMYKNYNDKEIFTILQKSFLNYQYERKLECSKKNIKINTGNRNLLEESGCKIKDINKCFLFYEKKKDKLKTLEIILGQNRSPNSEKKILVKEIAGLKKELANIKPIKCPKEKRRTCINYFRDIEKQEKLKKKKEKALLKAETNKPDLILKKNFDKKLAVLNGLGYIDKEELSPRGVVCSRIHIQEIFITELLSQGVLNSSGEERIASIVGGLVMEDDYRNNYESKFDFKDVYEIIEYVHKEEIKNGIIPTLKFNTSYSAIIEKWMQGESVSDIVQGAGIREGDFVSLCRRTVDLLRQIKNTQIGDKMLKGKIENCISRIDKDIVSFGL